MKLLFLPNWDVRRLKENTDAIQSPDKQVDGMPYWIFQYFPKDTEVNIIDRQPKNCLHRIEKKIRFYIWQSVLAFGKAQEYDVVISHGAQSGLVYALLSLFRKKKNRPLHIIIDVGGLNGGRDNRIETTVIKLALKSNPAIIYHASIQQKFYETVYKGLIKKNKFIPFGVNREEFCPLHLPAKDYVLSFGYSKRDYPTLLEAWQEINTSTQLYIVGDTSMAGRDNMVSLPKVSVSTLKQYIAQSLFVVIPLPVFNYSYGQMSFLQSMAMGKPVIVTKTPSTIDYLQNAQGAFLVEPYNVADMRNKIEFLLTHRDLLDTFGNQARETIINRHLDERTMAERIYKFIQS